jgi:DNA ligase-1
MRLSEVVAASAAVAGTSGRLEKIGYLADLLVRTPPDELEIVVSFLTGEPRQGRLGVGGATLAPWWKAARDVPPASSPAGTLAGAHAPDALELHEVDAAFARLAGTAGAGSAATRSQVLRQLLGRATRDEQDFLVRLLFGELRQGALEGVVVEAVARGARISPAHVRRAVMLAGSLAVVARAALVEGEAGLSRFVLQPFKPVQPMLADSAADVSEALASLGEASFEYKLDGARIQVHKRDNEVRVFSRNLRDVTVAVPEVVAVARAAPAREIVLDGEAIVMRSDGLPQPFQVTMRRFGRKLDVDRLKQTLPITPFFFDVLYLDGGGLIDEPLAARIAALRGQVAPPHAVAGIITANAADAAEFAARALAAGHEGVMAKALDAGYRAGRRGSAWLKVKQARTLDLVILAAEWGSGRRQGTLSNLHLGARDAERGGFVMLGKTFKGLTDEMLGWQTKRFLELEIARDAHTVYVRPEVVAEVAFNDIQASSQYPGGLALRFARVKGYRSDKSAADADTFDTIQAIYRQTTGQAAPVR